MMSYQQMSVYEMVEHLFIQRNIASHVWKELTHLLHFFIPQTSDLKIDYRIILLNIIRPPFLKRAKQMIAILVNLHKTVIWEIPSSEVSHLTRCLTRPEVN